MTELLEPARVPQRTRLPLIDCDIHVQPKDRDRLARYLPPRWRQQMELFRMREASGAYYPRANEHAARTDAWPPAGGPPGSDLGFLREQLLDRWDIDVGILTPLLGTGGQRNLEFGGAYAAAVNDWQLAEWLEPEPRLRGSLVAEYEDPELAVREIERLGDDSRFVQVLLSIRTAEPLGRRRYWPLFEAAVRHDLPVAVHFGGSAGHPITGAGWPSFYYEDHSGMPTVFQAQVISLLVEGVFERFPHLRIVLIEGGFAWLASLMWRLDDATRRLHEEVPHLHHAPSFYLRRHFWTTTQPIEEPERPEQFATLLRQIGMPDRLMFATDYPHWDFDAPDQALPAALGAAERRAIRAGNASRLYGLGIEA
ncbi:MAG: amidohydrolase family protein [Candidatus Dormibacteraceae bacterium]